MLKVIKIFVPILLLVFLLAACRQEETTEDAGFMRISVMTWDASASFGDQLCEVYEYIRQRFGIEFIPYNVSWDNMHDLPHLWAAAGTLPDIIGGVSFVSSPTYFDWIDRAIVRPLPDDLSGFPYVAEWINQPFVQALNVNGNTYFIPRGTVPYSEWTVMARNIINRRDWREQLGIPIPETTEDFLNMWRAFSNPENNLGSSSTVFGVLPAAPFSLITQTFATFGDTRNDWLMLDDGSMVIPAFEPTSLPLLSFWRQVFNERLMYPDFVTQALLTSLESFAAGRAGTLLRQASPLHLYRLYEQWQIFQPDLNFHDSIEILFPPYQPGVIPRYLDGAGFWSETYINANVNDEKMNYILAYFNWAKSQEGLQMMVYGFEGQDFVYENGEIRLLTDVNPITGRQMVAADLYLFAHGGMRDLAIWSGDALEFENPAIPIALREMSIAAKRWILDTPGNDLVQRDPRINTLHVEEANALPLVAADEWVAFITNTSAISDEDLFWQFYSRWLANGYEVAREAMTREVQARGYRPYAYSK
ncbi:MAG: hypothetical protein FWE42_07290 [Defluviitaleaceae bacterium]|nr:hypothetical protein [Defluviitaleaceae bacterium]